MTEWKEYKFSDFVDINPLVRIPQNIPISFVEMKDLDPSMRYCESSQLKLLSGGSRFINGDTLFARITPCLENGKICQVRYLQNNIGFGSTEFHVFRAKNGISDTNFVYYLSRWNEVREHAELNLEGSSGRQRVSKEAFDNLYLLLPPLPEQIRIASILSSLDDKIDLLHRENKTLEAMAETLFRQWFIEEAKEDCEEKHLSDYVIDTLGGDWGKENPEGDFIKPVQCIRGTDIADLSVGLATKTPIRYVKESKFEKIEPRNGDIIMEISGGTEKQSTGRVAYVNDEVKTLFDYPIIFSNFCRLLRVKEEHTYFIYCYLKYLYDQDEFFNLENGSSGIKNLDYKTLLYEITYPMPNDKLQILDFNDNVSVYFEKINRNKKQIKTLIQQRDSLLPKLMSGEVKI
mgnify:CR=1 FL=1